MTRLEILGQSVQGRDLPLLVIHDPSTGPEEGKAAMWIDGNVHGNEVQGAEAALYTAWLLLERRDLEPIRKLVAERVFSIVPMVNPDGRTFWFVQPNTMHSSRSGLRQTRAAGTFLLAHPNVAAVQSFHNAGRMILRGPGYESFGSYPAADRRIDDRIGEEGEAMLPFYRYLTIWKDLSSVDGGLVNWTYEGLGIFSFTTGTSRGTTSRSSWEGCNPSGSAPRASSPSSTSPRDRRGAAGVRVPRASRVAPRVSCRGRRAERAAIRAASRGRPGILSGRASPSG